MERKSRTTTLVTCLAVLLVAVTVALAEPINNFQPSGSSGDYSNASNWSLSHVPQASERIVIKQGKTCNVNQDTVVGLWAIDVETNAVFDVLPGYTAYVAGGGTGTPTSHIDGVIYLNREATGDPAKLHIRNNHEFEGAGKIFGGLVDSQIEIFSGTTTSGILIEGYMKITGSGDAFVNIGTIHAKYPGGVVGQGEIWVNLIVIADDSTALWKATTHARLRIDGGESDPMDLDGDFFLDDGILEIDYPGMTTDGGLTSVNDSTVDSTVDCSELFNDFGIPADPVLFLGTPGQ